MTTGRLRGRAASRIRPGLITKQVLMGELPLETGETVSEAAIVDLFNAYKRQVEEHNQLREKSKHIKGMHYRSYYTMFKFAQLLNLVEFVRTEPMLYPPPHGTLYSISKPDGVHVIESVRRVFRLSVVGKEDVKSWLDLTRAWKEQWPAPQVVELPVYVEERIEVPVEEAPPEVEKVRKPKVKVEKVLVPTLKLQTRPSKEQYVLLLDHLHKLNEIGIDNTRVQREIDKLANMVGEWVAEAIESLQDAQDLGVPAKVIEFRYLRNVLTEVDEGLIDRDIPRAIEHLEKLI